MSSGHPTSNIQRPTPRFTRVFVGDWLSAVGRRALRSPRNRFLFAGRRPLSSTRGFTLVEVLLTALLLGIGMTALLSSLSVCLRTMKLARQYDEVEWVLGLGELTYPDPLTASADVQKDYKVDPDTSLQEGFTFERVVDKKTPEEEEKDRLFIVRTRVTWGEGGEDDSAKEELVRYVWERKQ